MAWLAMVVLVILMTITLVDVTCRHTFLRPPWGAGGFEVTELLMTQLACLALAMCWYAGGHIRVDMVLEKSGTKGRALLNLLGTLCGTVWLTFMSWSMVEFSVSSRGMGSATDVLKLAHWPFQLIFAIAVALFVLVLIRSIIGYAMRLFGGKVEPWTVDPRDL